MVLRPITFKKQLIQLFYPQLTLEKEVKWWSLLYVLIIYRYCLQRLVASLKFVNTKCDNYLLTLNCTEAHVTIWRENLANCLLNYLWRYKIWRNAVWSAPHAIKFWSSVTCIYVFYVRSYSITSYNIR